MANLECLTEEEEAFIHGVELAQDWNFRDISEEDFARYDALIRKREAIPKPDPSLFKVVIGGEVFHPINQVNINLLNLSFHDIYMRVFNNAFHWEGCCDSQIFKSKVMNIASEKIVAMLSNLPEMLKLYAIVFLFDDGSQRTIRIS